MNVPSINIAYSAQSDHFNTENTMNASSARGWSIMNVKFERGEVLKGWTTI